MHIVLLNDHLPSTTRGGAAIVVERLRYAFAKRGHQVTLITTHQDRSSDLMIRSKDEAGDIISIYREYPQRERHRRCISDPTMANTLRSLLRELKPDVVHAHNLHTYLTYQALEITHEFTNRIFLTAHDTFLVSFGRVAGSAYETSVKQGTPLRMHWWDHVQTAGRTYWPLRNQQIKRILRRSGTKVTAISRAQKEFLEANGISVHAVVPNGVEMPHHPSKEQITKFREQYNLEGPTILFAGRVNEDKGIPALLTALAIIQKKFPTAQCLVVGDGVERAKVFLAPYDDQIRSMVIFANRFLSPEEMNIAYAAVDVVTTPSVYFDAFNLINIEAMSAGKPVVGTIYGGTPEIIIDGETGFVRDPRSPAFAEALIRCLEDRSLSKKMGLAGKKRVEENYSLAGQTDRLLQLFATQ